LVGKSKGHRRVLTADFGFLPTTKKTIETKDNKKLKKQNVSPLLKKKASKTTKGLFLKHKMSCANLNLDKQKEAAKDVIKENK